MSLTDSKEKIMDIRVKSSSELFEALLINGEKRIFVEKGSYEIDRTIYLDSNTEIISEEGALFSGSRTISLDGIRPDGDVYKIKLSDYGIADFGEFGLGPYREYWKEYDIPKPNMEEFGPSLELYFGKKKMNLTRYPRAGFSYVKSVVGNTVKNDPHGKPRSREEGLFIPYDHKPFLENDVSELLLVGYWNWDWATQRHLVDSYDKESGVVKVNEPYHVFGYSGDGIGHYYALNVKSELKRPGDWYIDRKCGVIYLIPYKNQKSVDITVVENMFEARGKCNIKISGISVIKCRRSAYRFDSCDSLTLENATVSNVGAWAVIASNCVNTTVSGFSVSKTGGGGISISGGDRNTLTPSNNKVTDNKITDIAYWHKMYLAGIEINGVGITVSNNLIHDVVHSAIMWQGNDHVIEYNEIYNASYESNDAGAIYAGRDYTCRGTHIRYNYIHDLYGYKNLGCAGVYFDDGLCSAEVYGNTFANIAKMAILVGGGRDFNIHHNSFFNCGAAMTLDDRYFSWSNNAKNLRHLEEVPYRSEIWRARYPELYTILDGDPKLPTGNRFDYNTVIGGSGVIVSEREGFDEFLSHRANQYKPFSLIGIKNDLITEVTKVIALNEDEN